MLDKLLHPDHAHWTWKRPVLLVTKRQWEFDSPSIYFTDKSSEWAMSFLLAIQSRGKRIEYSIGLLLVSYYGHARNWTRNPRSDSERVPWRPVEPHTSLLRDSFLPSLSASATRAAHLSLAASATLASRDCVLSRSSFVRCFIARCGALLKWITIE